jgi:hypothetical protein
MTRTEFLREKRSNIYRLIALALGIPGLHVLAFFALMFSDLGKQKAGPGTLIVLALMPIGYLLGALLVRNRLLLKCHACGRLLYCRAVVQTGQCCFCQAEVFAKDVA